MGRASQGPRHADAGEDTVGTGGDAKENLEITISSWIFPDENQAAG